MWHEQSKAFVEAGKVGVIGIIQEQHPQRAKLFMQWKQMDWPLLTDSLNLLGVTAVPITLLVDEHGIVRKTRAKPRDLEAFLKTDYQNDAKANPIEAGWITDSDRRFLRARTPAELTPIIAGYQTAERAELFFRLGAIHRARFDSATAKPNDFTQAISHWQGALDRNPNQYIWRRRIQQFGPRLTKPYPFYDWVPQARKDIRARGETPARLIVEPRGSEIARPIRRFTQENAVEVKHPDPTGKLDREARGAIQVETVMVPPVAKPGSSVRVHLVMKPKAAIGKWNNEAEPLIAFPSDLPEGWKINRKHYQTPMSPKAESTETRIAEFELSIPRNAKGKQRAKFTSYFYLRYSDTGVCQFLAQDIEVDIEVR
ncbi:MAG: TlpA family protein disulfide reductase [Limisphaerales bacterium]